MVHCVGDGWWTNRVCSCAPPPSQRAEPPGLQGRVPPELHGAQPRLRRQGATTRHCHCNLPMHHSSCRVLATMACWLTGLLVALVRAQIDPRFKPSMHIFYGSGTINVFDGLPKVSPVVVAQCCPCGTCAHVRPCLSVSRAWMCVCCSTRRCPRRWAVTTSSCRRTTTESLAAAAGAAATAAVLCSLHVIPRAARAFVSVATHRDRYRALCRLIALGSRCAKWCSGLPTSATIHVHIVRYM